MRRYFSQTQTKLTATRETATVSHGKKNVSHGHEAETLKNKTTLSDPAHSRDANGRRKTHKQKARRHEHHHQGNPRLVASPRNMRLYTSISQD